MAKIIKATPEHISSINSVVTAAYTKYIERIGKPPAPMLADYSQLLKTHDVFVLQDADATSTSAVLGSIILKSDDESDSIKVNNLVVDPALQGRGYGRLLMDFAEERARGQRRSALTLFTNVKMYENLGLYAKLGFVETERRVEDGYERVFFRKALN
ncbi:GNAT family N-acetyltransferase [Aspergillus lucknowensis]|uniref:Acyl-CoA N-acyltransferase n=1 Tax=Aspergillus lucknowensis TaxID=176173 RepID=A0ABR4LQ10_9EURO